MDDSAEFRGAVDDFLDESEASTGELNVLVDAVRLGAVRRLLAMLDQGASQAAAVTEVGDGLARDRGSDDPARSRWAVAVLGHALGKVDGDLVQRFAVVPGSSSTPAPPSTPAPAGPTLAPSPAFPPPPPPARVALPPTAPVHSGGTVPFAGGHAPGHPAAPRRRGAAAWIVLLGLAILVVAVSAVGAVIVLGDDDETTGGRVQDGPTDTGPEPPAEIEALDPGVVVSAPGLEVSKFEGTAAMASRTGGVALVGTGSVGTVGEGGQERGAPEGGSLLAFRLDRYDGCAVRPCSSWKQLPLVVEVDGARTPLPKGGPTFVVALPSESSSADLVYRADGFRQSLSLSTGEPTGENIAVLARDREARSQRISEDDGSFRVVFSTEPSAGLGADDLTYDIRVSSAELYFFEPRRPLQDANLAYLHVVVHQSRVASPSPQPLTSMWLSFADGGGKAYTSMDLDPSESGVDTVFRVPGDLRGGVLTIGGTHPVPTTNGTVIQLTIPERTVPLRFGR
jgi:hypothetical protein